MDFRAAALAPPAAHMPSLFTQPPALPPPPPQPGMFLYPGLSSPVKPPSHLLPPSKVSRNTATVPPLHQTPSSAHQATSSVASSQSSSFAAALKSLARNAGGTDAKEPSNKSRDPAPTMSPKRVPLHVPRAPHTDNPPPVVAIAPTPTHQRRDAAVVSIAAEVTKPEVSSHTHLSPVAGGGGGFQPYRPDDRLLESLYPGAGYAPSALYPQLPRPGTAGYPAARRPEERYMESLYPLPPMQHQLYGLEEQLYLERLGLLRPGLTVGGLSAYSPLLSAARYPPDLLQSPLYLSQSLYLQERLKLEEDTRRKMETERERERERSRESSSSHRVATPPVRERSPIRPASSAATTVPQEHRNGTIQARSPPAERRSTSGSDQQTSPAAYRPYLTSPVSRPAAAPAAAPPLDLSSRSNGSRNGTLPEKKRSHHKKTTVVRPFEDTPPVTTNHVAPPVDTPLNLSEKSPASLADSAPAAITSSTTLTNGTATAPPPVAVPEPKLQPKIEPKLEPTVPLRPEQTESLTSTLDRREQLRKQGVPPDEVEPAVQSMDLLSAPACETVASPDKLQFLAHVGLTTHSYRNGTSPAPSIDADAPGAQSSADDVYTFTDDPHASPEWTQTLTPSRDVELAKCERRAALHLPLASSPEGSRCSEPEPEPRPSSRLTAALNHTADVPAKLLFLDRLGLRPVVPGGGGSGGSGVDGSSVSGGSDADTAAGPVGGVTAAGGTAASSSGTTSAGTSSTAGATSAAGAGGTASSGAAASHGSSGSQRKTDSRQPTSAGSSKSSSSGGSGGGGGGGSNNSDEKGRRHRASPSSRSGRSSRPPPQTRNSSPSDPGAGAEAAARLAASCGPWPGMEAITHMYTVYNKERAAALDQAKRHGDRLRAQQARLEETSRTLALRLNRQVAYRNLQWQQRDAVQEQLDRLSALVRALPSRTRRKV